MSQSRIFEQVKTQVPNRNMFDLSSECKTSMRMGKLNPCFIKEVVPGDSFSLGAESLIRFAPMIAPVYQKFYSTVHYFFVPNRILWKNWYDFITRTEGDAGKPAFPYVNVSSDNWVKGGLLDRLGIPKPIGAAVEKVNALPIWAYQKTYNDWFRDQNLIPDAFPTNGGTNDLANGDNTAKLAQMGVLQTRAWQHDYFTSCLPTPQKGAAVTLPVGGLSDAPIYRNQDLGAGGYIRWVGNEQPANTDAFQRIDAVPGGVSTFYAALDGMDLGSISVNDFREAMAIQKWMELNNRAGTRPIEWLRAHFDEDAGDARLQRPEYITGVKSNVTISEVLNTTGTDALPQGNMSGHGIGTITDDHFGHYHCTEHGFIIGIMSVMPTTSYQQGLEKFWLKTEDTTQYYDPMFAELGEQPVFNREIYAFTDDGNDTFGYLPIYQDYRSAFDMVTGDMREDLAFWHDSRVFDNRPMLNQEFVECNPRKDIFAVEDPTVDELYVWVRNKCMVSRKIPVFGVPAIS